MEFLIILFILLKFISGIFVVLFIFSFYWDKIIPSRWNWRYNNWWRRKGCYWFKTCPVCLTPRFKNGGPCKKCEKEFNW